VGAFSAYEIGQRAKYTSKSSDEVSFVKAPALYATVVDGSLDCFRYSTSLFICPSWTQSFEGGLADACV